MRVAAGLSIAEVVIVIALLAVLASTALPTLTTLRSWQDDQQVAASAQAVVDALELARSEAIRTHRSHIVAFAGSDDRGNAVPLLVIADGAPGAAGNCKADDGERVRTWQIAAGVDWAAEPREAAEKERSVVFSSPDGRPAMAVLFRPDGVPVTFDEHCAPGRSGSGGGTVYLRGASRNFAVTLSPLGSVETHASEPGWSS